MRRRTSRILTAVLALSFVATALFHSTFAEPRPATQRAYQSPYSLKFTFPTEDLIGDILHTDRGKPELQSSVPVEQWYSESIKSKWGAWGVPTKAFPPPDGIDKQSSRWKRERVLATAIRYDGYTYQHHHLPDWNPPTDWPWKEVGHGSNAKGVDCSNFTGFVYNLSLGIKITSDCVKQSTQTQIKTNAGVLKFEQLQKPKLFANCKRDFRTGDLLFIKNKAGDISHVVLWVGDIGQSLDNTPLILDSTGSNHTDSTGNKIPDGVHLRPFTEKGWYWNSLSHGHRIIADQP